MQNLVSTGSISLVAKSRKKSPDKNAVKNYSHSLAFRLAFFHRESKQWVCSLSLRIAHNPESVYLCFWSPARCACDMIFLWVSFGPRVMTRGKEVDSHWSRLNGGADTGLSPNSKLTTVSPDTAQPLKMCLKYRGLHTLPSPSTHTHMHTIPGCF